MNKISRWYQFTKERFHPSSHITMILLFLIVHLFMAKSIFNLQISLFKNALLFISITSFYFKLRLYDEIKDYELDVIINPKRPLPRGLLSHRDMYLGMIVCISIELSIFSIQGINGLASILITICYSLIMFKEFFIKNIIRPHLTTYAILHTIVTSLLSFSIFSFFSQKSFLDIINNKDCLFFAIANWMLFNLFEFGRKTFAPSEERKDIDTYSSLFGKEGAVLLVMSQVLLAHFLIFKISFIHNSFLRYSHSLLFFWATAISAFYLYSDDIKHARRFRIMTSLYIILFYITLSLAYIIKYWGHS